jgi:hypothetical protein
MSQEDQINNIFKLFYPPDDELLKNSFLTITFDHCIPIGMNCNSSSCLEESNNRNYKLPFDWMHAPISSYKRMLFDMKNKNINFEVQLKPKVMLKHYDALIPHEPSNDSNLIKLNYIKYFERLNNILTFDGKNVKNICFVITSFSWEAMQYKMIKEYKILLNELYPNNNYFFLTVNVGNTPFVTKDHINIINKRAEGFCINGKWIGNIYNKPLFHFFSKYLSSTKIQYLSGS